jgi:hypothetical protein
MSLSDSIHLYIRIYFTKFVCCVTYGNKHTNVVRIKLTFSILHYLKYLLQFNVYIHTSDGLILQNICLNMAMPEITVELLFDLFFASTYLSVRFLDQLYINEDPLGINFHFIYGIRPEMNRHSIYIYRLSNILFPKRGHSYSCYQVFSSAVNSRFIFNASLNLQNCLEISMQLHVC